MDRNLNILNEFNILYIEDDKSLLTHTKDILDDFAKEVYAVRSSAQALEILEYTPSLSILGTIDFAIKSNSSYKPFSKHNSRISLQI